MVRPWFKISFSKCIVNGIYSDSSSASTGSDGRRTIMIGPEGCTIFENIGV